MPKPKHRPVRRLPAPYSYKPVERLWPGSTVVCIGAGPSLTQADVEYVRGKARTIVINISYVLAMWADVLYCCDMRVWKRCWEKGPEIDGGRYKHLAIKRFEGLKFSITRESARFPGVHVLQNTGSSGLEQKPNGLRNGRNSGYQAINLAVHLGATRILLLGYDMQRDRKKGREHWHDEVFGSHSPYPSFRESFQTIVKPLKDRGIAVINCSRDTDLACFPTMPLREALPEPAAAVA